MHLMTLFGICLSVHLSLYFSLYLSHMFNAKVSPAAGRIVAQLGLSPHEERDGKPRFCGICVLWKSLIPPYTFLFLSPACDHSVLPSGSPGGPSFGIPSLMDIEVPVLPPEEGPQFPPDNFRKQQQQRETKPEPGSRRPPTEPPNSKFTEGSYGFYGL